MSLVLLLSNQPAFASNYGASSLNLTATFTTQSLVRARTSLAIQFGARTVWRGDVPTGQTQPSIVFEIAFASQPLAASPAWIDVSDRGRQYSTTRGRSYEFERMETGTLAALLSNRDSALNPDNSLSPYAPVKSTRPVRARAVWDTTYPLFRGISEGYPQDFPHLGKDAVVRFAANDLFYALNNSRFTPGSTLLIAALPGGVAANTEIDLFVESTGLPMPQAVPFELTVGGVEDGWPEEQVTVTQIVGPTQYRAIRTAAVEQSYEHPLTSRVTTNTFSFGEEMSGVRIQNVLYAVGFPSASGVTSWPDSIVASPWWNLDEGQTLVSPSEDLANVNPLEHINLIVEAEFGRFFVSREGVFTFKDRHSAYVEHLSPDITFAEGTGVRYNFAGPLEHSDEKLFNRARITIQGGAYDGQVVDVVDQDSVDDHFERVYERTFPYANPNDADSAAAYVLSHSAETTVRLPGVVVFGEPDPEVNWPLILGREIGDRARLVYSPEGGGDDIDLPLTIDGISHAIEDGKHRVTFRCTEISDLEYWILGKAGYSELGTTTRVGF